LAVPLFITPSREDNISVVSKGRQSGRKRGTPSYDALNVGDTINKPLAPPGEHMHFLAFRSTALTLACPSIPSRSGAPPLARRGSCSPTTPGYCTSRGNTNHLRRGVSAESSRINLSFRRALATVGGSGSGDSLNHSLLLVSSGRPLHGSFSMCCACLSKMFEMKCSVRLGS
jgi:hypothetical protein